MLLSAVAYGCLLASGALNQNALTLEEKVERAIDAGDDSQLEKFLAAGVNPNLRLRNGATPLMIAAREASANPVTLLLKAKADVSRRDADGANALHYSTFWSRNVDMPTDERERISATIASLLVKAGVPVDVQDKHGRTPLMYAAWGWHPDVLAQLLKGGANVNLKDKGGRTALTYGAHLPKGHIWEPLVTKGAKVTFLDALLHKDQLLAAKLLGEEPDLKILAPDGRSCLGVAAENGSLRFVKALIKLGMDVNHADEDGNTPLMLAIGGRPSMVIPAGWTVYRTTNRAERMQ
jgi:ankyrin repeat protein